MTEKNFMVRFATTAVGRTTENITTLAPRLKEAFDLHGHKLPEVTLEGDNYQIRDLVLIGRVWQGVFARLKNDAPHKVNADSEEHELELDEGDRILEKCFFLYRTQADLLVWQNNRNVASLSKLQLYLCEVMEDYVSVNTCMNEGRLEEVLGHGIYEVQFSYARTLLAGEAAPRWAQHDFDRMRDLHAAHGKFLFRADRGGQLSRSVRNFLRQAITLQPVEKIRVRLTDETDPIDLFLAPVKDTITVPLIGRYPEQRRVYEELEAAYERNHHLLRRQD